MSQLPADLAAYTTDLPSGERLGNSSGPGSFVICAKRTFRGACCSPEPTGDAKCTISAPASKEARASATIANLRARGGGAGTATWEEIDWPEIASSAKARSQADWNRSS